MAQRRRRQERPRRRWRLRRGSPPAAPRSSRCSLAPPARLSGAPAGSAWLRRPGSPMRLGGRWASAPAATTAPSGVGGFAAAAAAAPGAGRVPSGGGCGLRDDPPGHAEAAAAAARGECDAASRGPGLAGLWPPGEGPGGETSGRADGASCRCGRLPHPGSGASALPPRVPRGAGGAWGTSRPRVAGKPLPRPGLRGGRVCGERGWQGPWHPSGWPRARAERSLLPWAPHVHPGGRQRTPVCKQPGLLRAPGSVPQSPGGRGREGEKAGAESAGPWKPLELPGVSFTHPTGLKTTFCVFFEVKFHHLPAAHLCCFCYLLLLSVVCLGESPIPALRC